MNLTDRKAWLFRLAVLTAITALLPIVVGALVTTKGAGMAFRDWPTSDGHNMFLYPWLESAGAQFVEHGHRLAGALIGLVSLMLVAVAWTSEKRLWVRMAATLVLAGVIAQGLLGGMRVLRDDPRIAMIHGSFAAMVFALMCVLVQVTSRSWSENTVHDANRSPQGVQRVKPLAVTTAVLILVQYMVGGTLRHLGMALYEHVAIAVLVALLVVVTVVVAVRSGVRWLRRPAGMLLAALVAQLGLGIGAFVTKYGFQTTGYVAVQDSLAQVGFRTAHTVTGMLLFMTSVVLVVRVFRLHWQARKPVGSDERAVAPAAPASQLGTLNSGMMGGLS